MVGFYYAICIRCQEASEKGKNKHRRIKCRKQTCSSGTEKSKGGDDLGGRDRENTLGKDRLAVARVL